LTAKQIHFQLEDAGVSWLFVSTRDQLDKVAQIRNDLPGLRGVVVFDHDVACEDAIPWRSFLQRGRAASSRWSEELARREATLSGADLATIMYTSGTTGNPKGVMLTHANLLSNAQATLAASPYRADDVLLSWLPYSHIYARTVDHYQSIMAGILVYLAESAETLVQNLGEAQPTHLTSVPRFYEKVLTAVASVASPDPEETGKRLRAVFGPRIDWLSSGGAPLPVPIAEAYTAAGLRVLQGYGLTESSPVISFNTKSHCKLHTVGRPIPGVEVAIASDGEVLTRGPHVMKGYWNNPEATAEAIRDGWLYTGDLGQLDADGFLSITGRKKELMVLSNGKKVVPSYLEGLLLSDPCIDQAVICGEGRNFLTALIVPHWENVRRCLAEEGSTRDHDPIPSLAKDPQVRALIRQRVDSALKDVANFEQVRKFLVLSEPFTVAKEELTVSLKLRRNVVQAHYQAELEELYRAGGVPEE
jgi:long-chain acyl-CoA synthetase